LQHNGRGELSKSSLERLYSYYLLAQRSREQGKSHVSSRQLSQPLLIGDTQVRKDMAAIGINGLPKRGYEIDSTLSALRSTLGLDQLHRAVLCGAGNLGRALLEYSRFGEFGFKLVGAFDIRPTVIGLDIGGTKVLQIDHLESVIKIFGVEIGIIAVNVWSAQEICDRMTNSGIKAIWNFAPLHLQAPESVLIRHEDFAGSLAIISHHLRSR
jgi:redox-sensing transcriptional repressor